MIHCQHKRGDSGFFRWLHKKNNHGKEIQIFYEKSGEAPRHHDNLRHKMTVVANGSLVISSFTEDNQGLYWCDICYQEICNDEMPTVFSVEKGQNYCYNHDWLS